MVTTLALAECTVLQTCKYNVQNFDGYGFMFGRPSIIKYSETSIIWTPLAIALMLAYWISEIVRTAEVVSFLTGFMCLVFIRYLNV